MRLTGSRAYYRPSPPKMPPGLVELMEGLTKEVLKNNPTDIYGFCAGHLEQLLEKRDGPSNKKSIPLEQKIARAQEKVRQRAEKRRQEYDKTLILQEQGISDSNNLILPPQQDTTEPQSQNRNIHSAKDNELLSPLDPISHNFLKAPVHHEQLLEKSSEVEICHDFGSEINSPHENSGVNQVIDTTNMLANADLNEANNVNAQHVNMELSEKNENSDLILSDNEAKVNRIEQDATSDIVLNVDTIIEGESTLVDQKLPDDKLLICVESPVEQSNQNLGNDSHTGDTNDEINPQILSSTDTVSTNQNLTDENNSTDDGNVAEVKENHTAINQIDRVQELSDTGAKQESDNTAHATKDTEVTQCSNNTGDTKDMNLLAQVEDSQQLTDIKDSQTAHNKDSIQGQIDNIQESDKTENGDLLRNSTSDIQQPNSTIVSEPVDKSVVQIVDEGVQSTNICATTENVISNEEGKYLTHHLHDANQEQLSDSTKNVLPESQTHLDVSVPNVDSDVPTLVTENSVNDAQQSDDMKNTTSDVKEVISGGKMIVKDNVDCDKMTSNIENPNQHDNQDINSVSEKNAEADNHNNINKDDNMGDGTQNGNDPSSMDLETAAVTIQKVFRTFLFKSRGSTFEDTGNDDANFMDEDDKNKEECDFPIASALNIERRAHGLTRMDTVLQTVNEEKSLSLSTDDSSTLSSAATIIQAHVRGFLVRNRLNSNKTVSTNSLVTSNSNEPSITSLEADNDQNKNKTILNIHIVPEGENYLSRDESLITSMDLSLDSSPPSSVNLHPLGYDKSERRKQLKREDAIQSISPPSNNSGKLSEDFDSVKELSLNDHDIVAEHLIDDSITTEGLDKENAKSTPFENGSLETISKPNEIKAEINNSKTDEAETHLIQKRKTLTKMNSDEMDVVTPYISNEDSTSSKLTHTGEFHDVVLPTRVSRSDTTVVSGE